MIKKEHAKAFADKSKDKIILRAAIRSYVQMAAFLQY
jgi:hypothetical protein